MKLDKKTILLQDSRIILRCLQPGDVTEEYVAGLNDPDVNRYLVNVRRHAQTRKTVEEFVTLNQQTPSCLLFGIFVVNDVQPFVGTVRVSDLDFFHFSASIGVCLFAKRAWSKGYAHAAVELIKDFLFNTVGLHYLEAGMYAENTDSIKLFAHCGFSEVYRVENKFRHVDTFKSAVYFAALNPKFNGSALKAAAVDRI